MEANGHTIKDNGSKPKKTTITTFEDILQKVGSFGAFQVTLFLLVSLSDITSSVSLQFFIFGAANPGYVCIANRSLSDDDVIKNGTFVMPPINSTDYALNTCDVDGRTCIRRVYLPVFTSIITEWDLVCEKGYYPTIITTLLMVGLGVGAAFFGHAADWWGRRPIFYFVTTLLVVCEFSQSFVKSWKLMVFNRFLVGVFSGATMVISSILPVEFIGQQHRTIVGCFGFWGVGTFILVLLAYFIREWRHLSIATAMIGVLFPFTVFFVPESIRWLLQHKRINQAYEILRRMASRNKRICPPKKNLEQIVKTQEFSSKGKAKKYTYKDLVMNAALRPRTLLMWYLWFCFTMMFYGIVLDVRDLSSNRYSNIAIMAAIEYVFNLSVIYTAHRFGRRRCLLGYMAINTVCMVAVMIMDLTSDTESSSSLLVVRTLLSLLGRGGVSAAWGVGYLLPAELFPTPMRNIGASGCSVAGRIGGVLAPQIAYLRNFHMSIPYIIFASFSIVGIALAFKFLPETKGHPLPDSLLNIEASLVKEIKASPENDTKEEPNGTIYHIARF